VRALVVYAHPSPDSLTHALYQAATGALQESGHDVVGLDLYAEQFVAAMSEAERRAYHTDRPILDPAVAHHADLVRWADALVFVYPTWWAGLPAILKGWLERVLAPGVAFHLDPHTHRVVSDLRSVRRVVGITTYGSSWAAVRLVNDGGRRTLLRALRMLCGPRCRTSWLALHSVDRATPDERARFVIRVEQRLRRL
jgi:NAD(P)H dehydrogenase (quinone)